MTPDALRLAAEWLDAYDGEGPETDNMKEIADFLRKEADKRANAKRDAFIRRESKKIAAKHDIPVEKVAARLSELLRRK
jgi:hypothetical protein